MDEEEVYIGKEKQGAQRHSTPYEACDPFRKELEQIHELQEEKKRLEADVTRLREEANSQQTPTGQSPTVRIYLKSGG